MKWRRIEDIQCFVYDNYIFDLVRRILLNYYINFWFVVCLAQNGHSSMTVRSWLDLRSIGSTIYHPYYRFPEFQEQRTTRTYLSRLCLFFSTSEQNSYWYSWGWPLGQDFISSIKQPGVTVSKSSFNIRYSLSRAAHSVLLKLQNFWKPELKICFSSKYFLDGS